MRLRILLLAVLAACVAGGVFVADAKAIAFVDSGSCPVSPDHPTLFLCPSGETGKTYSLQINARGGCDTYVWTNPGGNMPPGLSLGSSGLISGTPTTSGKWVFWLQIQDTPGNPSWCSDDHAAQRQFEIDILQGLQISERQSTLGTAVVNGAYSVQFHSTGGGGSVTWSIASGSLPAGLNLDANTGLLSGTPTATGDYHFQVKVSDGARSDVQTYNLTVLEPLKITAGSAAAGEVGQPFQATFAATGGKPAYTWSVASGSALPAGLTLNQTTGEISGTPTAAGVFAVKVTVTDAAGLTQSVEYRVAIASQLAMIKRTLPAVKVAHRYYARLLARGGVAPRTWAITRGSLPAGLRLNTRTGIITGTARRAGRSTVTIQVTDKLGVTSTATFSLKVVG